MNEANSHLLEMEIEENNIFKLTNQKFEIELALFKKGFERCAETALLIYKEVKRNDVTYSILSSFMIMPRLFISMKSILNLVLKGYYYDASILVRSWMECIGLWIYLSKNEDEARNWTMMKPINVSYIKLMEEFSYVWKDGKNKRFYPVYAQLSRYIHNLSTAIYKILKEGKVYDDHIEMIAPFSPSFNEKEAYETLFLSLPFFFWTTLNEVFSLNQYDEIVEYAKDVLPTLR